jgi:hypothetical protein
MMIHKNPEGLPLYLFDRSRLECAAECPRRYYWCYAFLGVGIVKARELPPYWPFITGSFIHEGIEMILKGFNGKDAATIAARSYNEKWAPIITNPDVPVELQAKLQMELDQEVDLVKALVYGWSLVGYPRLIASYEVVEGGIEQEEEISWLLSNGAPHTVANQVEMRLLTRTDILAKSLQSGGAILFNLKSVGDPSERWRSSFTRDMQTLTEAMAVEARLGIKVDGVIIEGLVKGKNSEYPKGSGFWQSSSMLIYAWTRDNTDSSLPGEQGGMEYATSWDYVCSSPHVMGNGQRCPGGKNHTLGKGFRKRPVRDCFSGGVYGWIDYLNRNDPATLESYFLQLPAISRDDFQVERWKRNKLHVEKERQDNAALVDAKFIEGDKEGAYLLLDHYFNMNEGYQCLSCAYHDICWGGADPMDESLWRPRTPNHLQEAEMLVQISQLKENVTS